MSRTLASRIGGLLLLCLSLAATSSAVSLSARTVRRTRPEHPLFSSSGSPAFIALKESIQASSRSHSTAPKGKADAGGKCTPAKPPVPCPGYDAEVGTDLVCMQLGCCYTDDGCFSPADAKPFGRADSKPPGELDSTPQLPPGANQAPAKKKPKSHDEYKEEMEMKILAQQQKILANQAKILQDIEHRQAKERAEKFDKMHSDAAAAGGLADPHKPVETEDPEPEKEPGKTYISWDKYKNPNDKPSPYWTATNAGAWHPQIPDYHRIATYTAPRYQPYYIAGGQYEYKAGPFFYREGQRLKYPNAVFNNHQPVAAPDLHIHKFDEPDPYDNPNPFPGMTQLPDILPSDRGGASSEETFGLKTSNDKLPIAPGIRVDPHYHQIQQLISNPAGPYKEGEFLELESTSSSHQIDRLALDPDKPGTFDYSLSAAKRDASGQVVSPATVTMTPRGTPNGEAQVLTIPPVARDIEQASELANQFNQRANGNAQSNSNTDNHGFPYVLNNAHDVQSTPYFLREPAGKVIEAPEGLEDFSWKKIEDRTEGSNAEKLLAMDGNTAPPINYLRNPDPIQTPRISYPRNDPNSDHQIYPQMFPDTWDLNHLSGDRAKEQMIQSMVVGAMNMKPPPYYNPNPSWYNPMPNPNYPHTFPIQTARYPSPAEGDGGGGDEGGGDE